MTFFGLPATSALWLLLFSEELLSVEAPRLKEVLRCDADEQVDDAGGKAPTTPDPTPTQQATMPFPTGEGNESPFSITDAVPRGGRAEVGGNPGGGGRGGLRFFLFPAFLRFIFLLVIFDGSNQRLTVSCLFDGSWVKLKLKGDWKQRRVFVLDHSHRFLLS